MKKTYFFICVAALAIGGLAKASSSGGLAVMVDGLTHGGMINEKHAYCIPKDIKPSVPEGENKSPALQWAKGPKGTESYAIIMADSQVPTDFSTANKEDVAISDRMQRQIFFHWVLVDIPPDIQELSLGDFSRDGEIALYGRHGLNDYPKFLSKKLDEKTIAEYSNYDGPCPPWNDDKMHNYHFRVYALDVPTLENLKDPFTGADVMKAIEGHVLAEGELVGHYTLNTKILFEEQKP
jgi:Raf kinase inhibitor-like YbhB/YbcL family protein